MGYQWPQDLDYAGAGADFTILMAVTDKQKGARGEISAP